MGRENLKNPVVELKNREIEGPPPEVIDRHFRSIRQAIESIGEGCCGRFANNPLHGESGQLSGPACGTPLCVVKVGRNGNDRPIDGGAEAAFRKGF